MNQSTQLRQRRLSRSRAQFGTSVATYFGKFALTGRLQTLQWSRSLGSERVCYNGTHCLPSVLWRCWLGGRKGIRPVKTEWWGAGVVVCLERGADSHMAQLMPLPLTVSCFSKIQIGFTFLVPAHPGSPGQRAVERARARVCVIYYNCRHTL